MVSLLEELERQKFSGISNVSSPALNGTLVFEAGKCILVTFQSCCGDTGWEELQKTDGEEVDAALSSLDNQQIQLALEFNKSCRLVRAGRPPQPVAHQRPAPSAHRSSIRVIPAQKTAAHLAPLKSPVKPAPSRSHMSSRKVAAPPSHSVRGPPPHPSLFTRAAPPVLSQPPVPVFQHEDQKKKATYEPSMEDHDTSSFESDIDTIDSMDLDTVTDKIRTDCKTMIKQLQLDHLMEH